MALEATATEEEVFNQGNLGQIEGRLSDLSSKLSAELAKEAVEIGFLVDELQRRLRALRHRMDTPSHTHSE